MSPAKFRNKTMMSTLLDKAMRQEKETKIYIDREGRSKTVFVHRWYDCLCRKFQRMDKRKSPGTNTQIQQGCRLQNDYTKSQLLSYIPAMNIWDLKIKTQYVYISVREERHG